MTQNPLTPKERKFFKVVAVAALAVGGGGATLGVLSENTNSSSPAKPSGLESSSTLPPSPITSRNETSTPVPAKAEDQQCEGGIGLINGTGEWTCGPTRVRMSPLGDNTVFSAKIVDSLTPPHELVLTPTELHSGDTFTLPDGTCQIKIVTPDIELRRSCER